MVQVLPTRYNGIDFRSRTEARWARFFDAIKTDWEYEPQGYRLGDSSYLPDFWLPELGYWFEVKPIFSFDQQKCLIGQLAQVSDRPAILANGPPTMLRANLSLHDHEPGAESGGYVWWLEVQMLSDRKNDTAIWLAHKDGARSIGKGPFSDKEPGHISDWLERAYILAKNEKFGIR